MKNKTKYGIAFFALGSIMSLALSGAVFLSGNALEYTPELAEPVALKDAYFVGEEISIPSAMVEYGEEKKEAEIILHFPNNKSYTATKYVLSEPGNYTVEYRASFNGKMQSVFENFSAYYSAYSVSSGKDVVYYGQNEKDSTVSGLNVTLSKKDIFRYNYPINLGDYSKENSVVNIKVIPEKNGQYDFTELYVKFIDAYDEDNYVTTKIHNIYKFDGMAYMLVGAHNQPLKGRDWPRHDDRLFTEEFGMTAGCSLNGTVGTLDGDNVCEIFWDYSERQIFGSVYHALPNTNNMTADLDSLEYYTDLWDGFTTGEVFVEIWTDQNVNAGNICITKLGDCDLSNIYLDESQILPEIDVDCDEELPIGCVGMQYNLFDATATDLFTENVSLEKRVYKNYGTASQVELDSSKGYFVPQSAGIYTLEYTATNRANGKSVKTLEIAVEEEARELALGQIVPEHLEGIVGLPLSLPQGVIEKTGNGGAEITISVRHNTTGTDYKVTTKNGLYSFVPVQEGKYEITYVLSDYIGQRDEFKYEVEVELSEYAVVDEAPILPKYFIANQKYILPLHYGKLYSSDGTYKEIACDIVVKDSAGERKLSDNREYIPILDDTTTTVTIKYQTHENAEGFETSKDIVNVVDENNQLDLSKYFQVENGMSVEVDRSNKSNIIFTANNDGAKASFINELLATQFSCRLAPIAGGDIQKIDIVLTDAVDVSKANVFSFYYYAQDEKKCEFSVNNGRRYLLNIPFFSANSNEYLFMEYSSALSKVTINNNQFSLRVENDCLVNSTEVYFDFIAYGMESASQIKLDRICGQIFSGSTTVDRLGPLISLVGETQKRVEIGSEIELVPACALDVLSPTTELKVSVYDENNNLVTDLLSGKVINAADPSVTYKILCSVLGEYTVQYEAKDLNGKSSAWFYTITVVEKIAPVITLEKGIATNAKVGDFVKISKATLSEEATLFVYITLPNSSMISFDYAQYDGFTASEKGTYIVTYMAWDSTYNYIIEHYEIIVE